MGKSVSKAMTFEDNLSSKELMGLFGSSVRSKAVSKPKTDKYAISVRKASTGLLFAQLGLRVVKFIQRHQESLSYIGVGVAFFIAGWLA